METNSEGKSTITITIGKNMKDTLKRCMRIVVIIIVAAAAISACVYVTAYGCAKKNAIARDEAVNLAKMYIRDTEVAPETGNLFLKDVEHDIEVELLDMKSSYLIYEVEFEKPDKSRIFVDVNATTGVCSVRKISPPRWEELIPQL